MVDEGQDPEQPASPQDPYLQQAKAYLSEFFDRRRTEPFYERQLAVIFEQRGRVNVVNVTPLDERTKANPGQLLDIGEGFYHWITTKAQAARGRGRKRCRWV